MRVAIACLEVLAGLQHDQVGAEVRCLAAHEVERVVELLRQRLRDLEIRLPLLAVSAEPPSMSGDRPRPCESKITPSMLIEVVLFSLKMTFRLSPLRELTPLKPESLMS